MTFLRLLHEQATQNFTYLCSKSAAWYDAKASSYANAIKFLGQNEQEFGYTLTYKPTVLRDDCKVWILTMNAQNLVALIMIYYHLTV